MKEYTECCVCSVAPGMSHVRGIVDGGSTTIPEDTPPREGNKLFLSWKPVKEKIRVDNIRYQFNTTAFPALNRGLSTLQHQETVLVTSHPHHTFLRVRLFSSFSLGTSVPSGFSHTGCLLLPKARAHKNG